MHLKAVYSIYFSLLVFFTSLYDVSGVKRKWGEGGGIGMTPRAREFHSSGAVENLHMREQNIEPNDENGAVEAASGRTGRKTGHGGRLNMNGPSSSGRIGQDREIPDIRPKMEREEARKLLDKLEELVQQYELNFMVVNNACQALHHVEEVEEEEKETPKIAMKIFNELEREIAESGMAELDHIRQKIEEYYGKMKRPVKIYVKRLQNGSVDQTEEEFMQEGTSSDQWRKRQRVRSTLVANAIQNEKSNGQYDDDSCVPELIYLRMLFDLCKQLDKKIEKSLPSEERAKSLSFLPKFKKMANEIGKWFEEKGKEKGKKGREILKIYNEFVGGYRKRIFLRIYNRPEANMESSSKGKPDKDKSSRKQTAGQGGETSSLLNDQRLHVIRWRRRRTRDGRWVGDEQQPAGGEEGNGAGSSTALERGVEMAGAGTSASASASSLEMGEASAPMATEEIGTSGNTPANLTEVQADQELLPRHPPGFIAQTDSGTPIDLNTESTMMEDDGTSNFDS